MRSGTRFAVQEQLIRADLEALWLSLLQCLEECEARVRTGYLRAARPLPVFLQTGKRPSCGNADASWTSPRPHCSPAPNPSSSSITTPSNLCQRRARHSKLLALPRSCISEPSPADRRWTRWGQPRGESMTDDLRKLVCMRALDERRTPLHLRNSVCLFILNPGTRLLWQLIPVQVFLLILLRRKDSRIASTWPR